MKFVKAVFITVIFSLTFSPLCLGENYLEKIGPTLYKEFEIKSSKKSTDEKIKAIVTLNCDPFLDAPSSIIESLKKSIAELGGETENSAYNNVQVWISLSKVKEVARLDIVKSINLPIPISQQGVISEGVPGLKIYNLHQNGITGSNTKVGVIDFSFKSLSNMVNVEIPTNAKYQSFSMGHSFFNNDHGTSCAEIIIDVAPKCNLYIADINDLEVDFHNAINWFINNKIDIVSSSIDMNIKVFCKLMVDVLSSNIFSSAYGINQISLLDNLKIQMQLSVKKLVNNKITWVQAAGNSAETRWEGYFTDTDYDYSLNFAPNVNYNPIVYPSYFQFGNIIYVVALWDLNDDLYCYDDFDLYVYNQYGNVVTKSTVNQALNPLAAEACAFMPYPGNQYYIRIENWNARPQNIGILVGCDGLPKLSYNTPAKTINDGAISTLGSVITVGAVPYYNMSQIEPFSSRGPTFENIIKPDVVAPDRVTTRSEGSLCIGTSYSAPFVAGVCSLIKQIHPSWNPQQVKNYLENNALDLGSPGKDNTYGSGLVQAPRLQTPTPPPSGSRVSLSGKVTNSHGMPLCALVLVNGKHTFSCDGQGAYNLSNIPLDPNGKISVQCFCKGKLPYRYIFTPQSNNTLNITLSGETGLNFGVSGVVCDSISTSTARISGYISYNGQPLTAMALANGQYMFTKNPKGYFDLTVPKNKQGKVILQVYCANLMPRSQTYTPQ